MRLDVCMPRGEEDYGFFPGYKKGGIRGPAALFTPLALISAMGLYNASSRGLVYRVSMQGRTSLEHPACKGSSTGSSERGNF